MAKVIGMINTGIIKEVKPELTPEEIIALVENAKKLGVKGNLKTMKPETLQKKIAELEKK